MQAFQPFTLRDDEHREALDSCIEGRLDVLDDDGLGDSPLAEDLEEVLEWLKDADTGAYPLTLDPVATNSLSGEQLTALQDCLEMVEDEEANLAGEA